MQTSPVIHQNIFLVDLGVTTRTAISLIVLNKYSSEGPEIRLGLGSRESITISQSCQWRLGGDRLPVTWDLSTGGPTQANRMNPIPGSPNQPALDQINEEMRLALQKAISSSVWQFYKFVEAQWQKADTPTGFFPPMKSPTGRWKHTPTITRACSAIGLQREQTEWHRICHLNRVSPGIRWSFLTRNPEERNDQVWLGTT